MRKEGPHTMRHHAAPRSACLCPPAAFPRAPVDANQSPERPDQTPSEVPPKPNDTGNCIPHRRGPVLAISQSPPFLFPHKKPTSHADLHAQEPRPFSYPSAPTLTCQTQRSTEQFSQNVGHRLFTLACRRLLTLFQARKRPTGGSHRTRRRDFGYQRHALRVVYHHQGRRDTDLSCWPPRHGPRSRTQ